MSLILLLLAGSARHACCVCRCRRRVGFISTIALAVLNQDDASADTLNGKLCKFVYTIFVQLVEDFVSLVHKPHVLIVLGLASVKDDDHGSVESLLSNSPAYENCWMTMGEEEEGLQKLDRAVDDQRTTTNRSLMMETITSARTRWRICGTVDARKRVGVRRWRC